jgi:hypothetical protein
MGRICNTHGMKTTYKILVESLEGKGRLRHLGIDGRITLKCILEKYGVICGPDSYVSGYGTVAGSCEQGDEFSGSIRGGISWPVERLSDFVKDSTP